MLSRRMTIGRHVLTFLSEVDDNGDGVPSDRSTGSLTYDSQGQLVESSYEADFAAPSVNIDGVIDQRQTSTLEYDADGNVVRQVSIAQQTGFPPSTQIILQEYDSSGNLISYQAEADFDGDGTVDTRIGIVNTYDSRGRLLTSTTELDVDGDGTIDYISVVTTVYDGVKH